MKDVYLLSGFLGSGKTTLLVKFIEHLKNKGLRPAVIMNELGALGFDSEAVEGDVPLRELLDGCICCSPAEKTEAQIQQILYQEEFDVLLIETTGAAHPVASLDVILSPLFADQFDLKGILTVIDAKRFLQRDTLPIQTKALYLEQIRHAHTLIVNKTDLINEEELSELHFTLKQLNNTAEIIEAQHAAIDFEQLTSSTKDTTPHLPSRIGKELRLGSRLDSLEHPYPQYVVEEWVQSLPDSVYRIKGYVQLPSTTHPHLFQYSYGMTQWMAEDVKVKTQLVLIGENIKTAPSLEAFSLKSLLELLYPGRDRVSELITMTEIHQFLDEELLDVRTHPRTRFNLESKRNQIEEKVKKLDCSNWQEKHLLDFVTKRYEHLSTHSN